MTETEWTNEQVIRLIKEYKDKTELWDPEDNLFRMKSARHGAFCRLADSFECDITDLKKKLNSIFASHRREKTKVRWGGTSTWFLYSHLSFLPGHLQNGNGRIEIENIAKKSKKPPTSDEEEGEESDRSYNDNDGEGDVAEEIIIKQEPVVVEDYKPQPKTRPRLTRVVRRKVIKEQRHDNISTSRLIDTLNMLKKSDLMKKKDECDSFGDYIAVSLRKHDERTRSMIKQAINNILFEQEMKKYNSSQYTVVITGMEENPLSEHDREK